MDFQDVRVAREEQIRSLRERIHEREGAIGSDLL